MSFHFKMQKVLDYREQLEEEAKVRLARAESDLRACQSRLENLHKQLHEENARAANGPLMQNADFWLHDQYVRGLSEDIRAATLQEQLLKQMVDEARAYLAARAIDRKLLEKLKEKQKKQFVHAEQKQEQLFNDEIATLRYKAPAL